MCVPSLFLRQSLKGSFVFKDIVNIFFSDIISYLFSGFMPEKASCFEAKCKKRECKLLRVLSSKEACKPADLHC